MNSWRLTMPSLFVSMARIMRSDQNWPENSGAADGNVPCAAAGFTALIAAIESKPAAHALFSALIIVVSLSRGSEDRTVFVGGRREDGRGRAGRRHVSRDARGIP